MRAVIGCAVTAVLLLTIGAASWTSGRLERRVADAHKQLVTLRYAAPESEYTDIERSIRYADRLPWIANLETDIREQRATAHYWLSDYPSVGSQREAAGTDLDPRILLVAANAAYRAATSNGGRPGMPELESIEGAYAEVLRRAPGDADAAFNYEFVARMRQMTRRAPKFEATGDASVPAGPTIHGRPGAFPQDADMNQFQVVVPKLKDERKENIDPGNSSPKGKKG